MNTQINESIIDSLIEKVQEEIHSIGFSESSEYFDVDLEFTQSGLNYSIVAEISVSFEAEEDFFIDNETEPSSGYTTSACMKDVKLFSEDGDVLSISNKQYNQIYNQIEESVK